MFSVRLSNQAEKQVRRLDASLRSRVQKLFDVLEQTPVPSEYDVRKLKDEENAYRVRLSSFRVRYTVFWNDGIVRVTRVERRDETTYD